MATQIVAIRKESSYGSSYGSPHMHIAYVKTGDGRVLARSTVVQSINSGWDSFFTYVDRVRANVYVRNCPACNANDYITTTPDGTVDNNLLHLPTF